MEEIKDPNKEVDEINLIMNEYHDKKNKIGILYNEYTINYGKEYNMANLANTLLNSFNTFEKFYAIIEDKVEFAKKLRDLANMSIDLLEIKTEANLGKMRLGKKKRIVKKEYPLNKEKLTNLLNKIDEINDFLTKFCKIG
jgi:hypothetical protein